MMEKAREIMKDKAQWIIPLVIAIAVALTGWLLYGNERTSNLEHQTIKQSISTETTEREKDVQRLDDSNGKILDKLDTIQSDVTSLKAQMALLLKQNMLSQSR